MKVNILSAIKDYKGENIKKNEKEDITWQDVVYTSLNNFAPGEQPTSEVKQKCYQITKKIYDSNEPDLTVSEIAFILERIEKIQMMPIICGKAKEFFDKKEEEKK